MVNLTQDELAFSHDLLIQREVVLDIEHCLLAKPGTALADVKAVLSIPVATAQCHRVPARQACRTPNCAPRNSTAEAARTRERGGRPGIGRHRAADRGRRVRPRRACRGHCRPPR